MTLRQWLQRADVFVQATAPVPIKLRLPIPERTVGEDFELGFIHRGNAYSTPT